MTRMEVSKALAVHYTQKMNGEVWCYFDTSKRAYCIQANGLPSHPDLRDLYPNGWTLLDFIQPRKARAMIA